MARYPTEAGLTLTNKSFFNSATFRLGKWVIVQRKLVSFGASRTPFTKMNANYLIHSWKRQWQQSLAKGIKSFEISIMKFGTWWKLPVSLRPAWGRGGVIGVRVSMASIQARQDENPCFQPTLPLSLSLFPPSPTAMDVTLIERRGFREILFSKSVLANGTSFPRDSDF